MKKTSVAVIVLLLAASLAFAQNYSSAPAEDNTQDEKNLAILSKRLIRMKKDVDKFVKDMSVTYSGVESDMAPGAFGGGMKVDIIENDKDIVVTADLPGMDKDKIDIIIEGGRNLKISGVRHVEKKELVPGVVKQERMDGRFERVLELPAECKSEGISASYKDGVLEITIPKAEPVKKEAVKVIVQ